MLDNTNCMTSFDNSAAFVVHNTKITTSCGKVLLFICRLDLLVRGPRTGGYNLYKSLLGKVAIP